MYIIAVVGSRHRGWTRAIDHDGLIGDILQPRKEFYGEGLTVASIGCDVGFGKSVKAYCEEHGIKFFEFVVYFNGPRPREEYTAAYVARHAALLDCAHEFHITVSSTRRANVEDLVERVRASGKPYALYNEENVVIEYNFPQQVAPEAVSA